MTEKDRTLLPFAFLRSILALLMIVHGITRIALGIVDDFGGFLSQNGLPLGDFLAWAITIFEILGSILLILNFQVKYVCFYFIFQLLCGIFLVHLKDGWFVVGAGRNGVEYSVLLIAVFLTLAFVNFRKKVQ